MVARLTGIKRAATPWPRGNEVQTRLSVLAQERSLATLTSEWPGMPADTDPGSNGCGHQCSGSPGSVATRLGRAATDDHQSESAERLRKASAPSGAMAKQAIIGAR